MRTVKAAAPNGRILATHEEARLLSELGRELTRAELVILARWRAVQLAEARLVAPILSAVTARLTESITKSQALSALLNLRALEFNYISYSYEDARAILGSAAGKRLGAEMRVTHAACLRALGAGDDGDAVSGLASCESRKVATQTQLRAGGRK